MEIQVCKTPEPVLSTFWCISQSKCHFKWLFCERYYACNFDKFSQWILKILSAFLFTKQETYLESFSNATLKWPTWESNLYLLCHICNTSTMHFVPHTEHFISPTEKSFAFCGNLWGLPIIKHAKRQSDECYVGLDLFAALEKKIGHLSRYGIIWYLFSQFQVFC